MNSYIFKRKLTSCNKTLKLGQRACDEACYHHTYEDALNTYFVIERNYDNTLFIAIPRNLESMSTKHEHVAVGFIILICEFVANFNLF